MPTRTPAPAPSAAPTVHRWSDLAADAPMALLERRRVIGDKVMISHIVLKKGCDVPVHSHENEQFSIVLSGRLRFDLTPPGASPRREATVGPGEVIHLPGHAPHGAFALEDTTVLDIFAPPSQTTGVDRR